MAGAPAPPPTGQPPAAGGAVLAAAQPPVAAAPPAAGPPQAPVAPSYPYAPPPRRSPVVLIVVIVAVVVVALILFTIIVAAIIYVWGASFEEHGESSPIAQFTVTKRGDGTYQVQVVKVSSEENLRFFQFYLKDNGDVTRENGEIAIQYQRGVLVGVESSDTWDEKNPGENETELGRRAHDVDQEDDTCGDDGESDGRFPMVFYDNDFDDLLSSGDLFLVRGSEYDSRYDANSGWSIVLEYDGDIVGSKRLP